MKLHWLTYVVEASAEDVISLYSQKMAGILGPLVEERGGGRGYMKRARSVGAVLYFSPYQNTKSGSTHCCLDFTGSGLDCLLPREIKEFYGSLVASGFNFKTTRIDIAFDNCPFTVEDFYQHANGEGCRSLFKRETLSLIISPYQLQENLTVGCSTCYIGSRTSERFIRTYDQRGFTRLEFVCKGDRGQVVAAQILTSPVETWHILAYGHLLDYVDFQDWDAWSNFKENQVRANVKVSNARETSAARAVAWMEKQVAMSFFVLSELARASGTDYTERLYNVGAEKMEKGKGKRYAHLMELVKDEKK